MAFQGSSVGRYGGFGQATGDPVRGPNTRHPLNPSGGGATAPNPQLSYPGMPDYTPNPKSNFAPGANAAGGRTTAGYGYTGLQTHDVPSYGFAGGSVPRIQVPTGPPPAAGPGMASLPPQVLAILSMLGGGGQTPTPGTMGGMLGQLNNGGYGIASPAGLSTQVESPGYGMAAPQWQPPVTGGGGQPSPAQVQALIAMLGGGGGRTDFTNPLTDRGMNYYGGGGAQPGRYYY